MSHPYYFYFSILYACMIFVAQLLRYSLLRRFQRWLWPGSVLGVMLIGGYLSYLQYRVWLASPMAQFLLPPHQPWSYFGWYVFMLYFAAYVFSLAIAASFFFLARKLNQRYGERFFYPEEYVLIATGIFLSGHPGWLVFIAGTLLVSVIINLWYGWLKGARRISLYYLWMPMAAASVIMSQWMIQNISWFRVLKL